MLGERTAPLVDRARRVQQHLAASTTDFAKSTQALTGVLSQFRLP